jgi:hypothetical protein
MDLEGMGNRDNEQNKLNDDRLKFWTFVFMVNRQSISATCLSMFHQHTSVEIKFLSVYLSLTM